MIGQRPNMKRHFLEDSDRESLSCGSFSKRLKIDEGITIDPFVSDLFSRKDVIERVSSGGLVPQYRDHQHIIADNHSVVKDSSSLPLGELCKPTSTVPRVDVTCEPSETLLETIHDPIFDADFAAANPILRELHQQREERKLSRMINEQRSSKYPPSPLVKAISDSNFNYSSKTHDHTPVDSVLLHDPSDIWSNHDSRQTKFRKDYEARVLMEFESGREGLRDDWREAPPSEYAGTPVPLRSHSNTALHCDSSIPVLEFDCTTTESNMHDGDEMEID